MKLLKGFERNACCAALLLALGLTAGNAAANEAPWFEVPFACNQIWQGTTTVTAQPPQSIEFTRPSNVSEAVLASAAGRIAAVRDLGYGNSKGRYVVIEHGGGWRTTYLNLESFNVVVGQAVATGQKIATIGKQMPYLSHLYYEQSFNGVPESVTFEGRKVYHWGPWGYLSTNCMATPQ